MSAVAAAPSAGPQYEPVLEPMGNALDKGENFLKAGVESVKATVSGILKSTWRLVKNVMKWGKSKVVNAWNHLRGHDTKASTGDHGHGAPAAAAHGAGGGGHGAEHGHDKKHDEHAAGGDHAKHDEHKAEHKEEAKHEAGGDHKAGDHADAGHEKKDDHAKPEAKADGHKKDDHAKPTEAAKAGHEKKDDGHAKHARVIPFAARQGASKTFSTPVRMAA